MNLSHGDHAITSMSEGRVVVAISVVLISFVIVYGVYLLALKDLTPGLFSALEGAYFSPVRLIIL